MVWLVIFSAPVTYLAGHSHAQVVDRLVVTAPSARQATTHALRVTQGDAEIVSAEEVADGVVAPAA